jgi:hypothetical protein
VFFKSKGESIDKKTAKSQKNRATLDIKVSKSSPKGLGVDQKDPRRSSDSHREGLGPGVSCQGGQISAYF